MTIPHILSLLIGIILLVLLYDGLKAYTTIQGGKKLAQEAIPFSREIKNPSMRILIAGDSTAYGTGATDNTKTTAGRFGEKYNNAEIINVSQNGLKIDGLVLKLIDNNKGKFDIAVLQIGANDILRFTRLRDVEESLIKLLDIISNQSKSVVILHSGDVGAAPLFPSYVGHLYTKRAKAMRTLYMQTVKNYDNVSYVDLFSGNTDAVFLEDPHKYYATDGLHLSNEGYKAWFDEIDAALNKE